ncbi:type II toxin-antitoxin system VapC family toxin [Phyllobacterium leguminum]|uniref:Ribonuclease VapC n=1 Tax=Phyllobacterium leguminum TaxID=314237 RepID=A0A318TF73_9HYPH|nr:type II toxin-antitoxin system VapC family toxin [Phyllobacterium leguminum]PYE90173.1 ribonuclease VapC [Phyllobacterium leguminum]
MFLDASAIVAVLARENDANYFATKIKNTEEAIYYSSLTVFEAVVSIARITSIRRNGNNSPTPPELIAEVQKDVEAFLDDIGAQDIAVSGLLYNKALEAARTFGRFVGHPARLNFGDCFAYACAKEHGLPLLFKGDDFSRTDIQPA